MWGRVLMMGLGFEPSTFRSEVQRANHYTTAPPQAIENRTKVPNPSIVKIWGCSMSVNHMGPVYPNKTTRWQNIHRFVKRKKKVKRKRPKECST